MLIPLTYDVIHYLFEIIFFPIHFRKFLFFKGSDLPVMSFHNIDEFLHSDGHLMNSFINTRVHLFAELSLMFMA